MVAPVTHQAAWHWDSIANSITVDGTSTIPLSPITAGRSVIVLGASMNAASTNIEPITIGDNIGTNYGAPIYEYLDASTLRVMWRVWHVQTIGAGVTSVTMNFSNNYYPILCVFETDECTFNAPASAGNNPPLNPTFHADTGFTISDVLTICAIGGLGNSDFVDALGSSMPGYARFWDADAAYRRRYAIHYRIDGSHSNDRVPIDASIPNSTNAFVTTFSAASVGALPPSEDTPTPDLPAVGSYTQGDAINVDVSGNWSVGTGGTGPLTFTASAEMTSAGLAMSTAGVITGTATFANAATGLTYTVDDAANNGPTTSSTFNYNVLNPAPVEDTPTQNITVSEGVAGSVDVSANWSVGPGGTEPLGFTAGTSPAWPAGLTISTIGLLEWTAAVAPGPYTGLTYTVDDVANNGPVTSTPFDFTVTAAIGTLRTPPAVEVDATGNVIDVRGLTACTVEVWTLAGARVYREENIDQSADGRFVVQNAAITSGTSYFVGWMDPTSGRGSIISQIAATSG